MKNKKILIIGFGNMGLSHFKSFAKKNEIKIYGSNFIKDKNKNITVPNLGDHRICMSTTILSLATGIKTKINNFETVKTSSPNFLKIIKSL